MMMSLLEHVVTCHTMSNVREKSGHETLFSNIAFMSNRIDDVTARHATCCDLSQHVLEKSLITLFNKVVDACKRRIFIVLNNINNIKYDAANT